MSCQTVFRIWGPLRARAAIAACRPSIGHSAINIVVSDQANFAFYTSCYALLTRTWQPSVNMTFSHGKVGQRWGQQIRTTHYHRHAASLPYINMPDDIVASGRVTWCERSTKRNANNMRQRILVISYYTDVWRHLTATVCNRYRSSSVQIIKHLNTDRYRV